MKKILIIVIIVLAVLLLAGVAVWLFFFGPLAPEGTVIESGDGESLYPYRYETCKKGWIVTVTAADEFPEEASWSVSTDPAVLRASSYKNSKGKDASNEARFLLEPAGKAGETEVTLLLSRRISDGETRPLYKITVRLYVDENGKIVLIRNYSYAIAEPVEVKGESFTAKIMQNEDGTLSLFFTDPASCEWKAEILGNAASAGPVGSPEASVTEYAVGFLSVGQSRIRLHNMTLENETLEVFVTTDLLGRVNLISAEAIPFAYAEEGEGSIVERLSAAIDLPAGYTVLESRLMEWPSGDGEETSYPVVCLSLYTGDEQWKLYISEEIETSVYLAGILPTVTVSDFFAGNGVSANLYVFADGSAAVWENASGIRFLLVGPRREMSAVTGAIEAIFGVTG